MSQEDLSSQPTTNLEKVLYYFQDYESPEHFLIWNYLYAVASCLGRKVFFQEGEPIFPNIFVIPVGDPGIGKSMPAKRFASIISSLMKKSKSSNELVDM